MNAWDNLPNATLVDQVLAELRANPKAFAADWSEANAAAWSAARDAADTAWGVAWAAARDAARDAANDAAWDAARGAAWCAAWDAISAFIAYDDSPKYLEMTYEELRVWAVLSEDPAAVLLVPYVLVREQIKELT